MLKTKIRIRTRITDPIPPPPSRSLPPGRPRPPEGWPRSSSTLSLSRLPRHCMVNLPKVTPRGDRLTTILTGTRGAVKRRPESPLIQHRGSPIIKMAVKGGDFGDCRGPDEPKGRLRDPDPGAPAPRGGGVRPGGRRALRAQPAVRGQHPQGAVPSRLRRQPARNQGRLFAPASGG